MWIVYIQSGAGENRYFNRVTQGFTARKYDGNFSCSRGDKVNVFYATGRKNTAAEKLWQAMAQNDSALTLTYKRVN